jgi:aspartate-semialdehyde dehydrogenase
VTLRIAVIGATGVVGREMIDCLQASDLDIADLRLFASPRSRGAELGFRGRALPCEVADELDGEERRAFDYALFAAGSDLSRRLVPTFLAAGVRVIDNASLYRMEAEVPLVVPEINLGAVKAHHQLIANPNCSTIIALMAVAPLQRAAGLRRLIAATYQAASGAGAAGLAELEHNLRQTEEGGSAATEVFGQNLASNLIPWIGPPGAEGEADCEEEQKLRRESRKILGLSDLEVSCTTVRVPVRRTHALALTIETESALAPEEAAALIEAAPGLALDRSRDPREIQTPQKVAGGDLVVVSRLRRAFESSPGLSLFVMGDQIRKGAAQNAVQILVGLAAGH